MSRRSLRIEWVPPLLVGAAGAVAAEVAGFLLLYGGPGLVRSLTTVLAVEGLALAAGLWSAPTAGDDLVDRVRRWWIFALLAFLVAATFGSAWTFVPAIGEGRAGQALGLVLLGALPLFACGAVLGGIGAAAATDQGGRLSSPAAAGAAGAATGFVLTGFLLPRVPMPGTMLVACLLLLSVAGMLYGVVLGARTEITVEARRPTPNGEVLVRERRVEADDVAQIELVEAGCVRRIRGVEPQGGREPWDVAIVRALMPEPDRAWRMLHVGGGASSLPRSAVREHPAAAVDVAERTAAVVELGREYFETELSLGSGERYAVVVGNLDDLIASVQTTYDVLVVDLDALRPIGGFRGLSRAGQWRLFDALDPGGTVVLGPTLVDPLPEDVTGWVTRSIVRAVDGASVTLLSRTPWPDEVVARFDRFEAT